jgi:hypothetical protein
MTKEIQNTQNSSLPAFLSEFQAVSSPTTYQDVINCPSAKLRPFEAKYGKQALSAVISSELMRICKLMSFETSDEMVVAATDLIILDYPDTKLADFKMFANDVLRGKVGGKLFRWDTRTIMEAWTEYYRLREEEFAAAREAFYQVEKKAYNDAYDRAYAEGEKERDMKKEYEILKKQGEMEAKIRTYKLLPLKQICELEGADYETLVMACEVDCRNVWTDDSVISFDDYLKLHLVRVANEVRRNPKILEQYTI